MNYDKYIIRKTKTDLLTSLKSIDKKIIKEELRKRDLDNINELRKEIIREYNYHLEYSKSDYDFLENIAKLLKNENTNKLSFDDEDIESFFIFIYKKDNNYSYYIPDEIKKIINSKIDLEDISFEEEDEIEDNFINDIENYVNNISKRYLDELYNKIDNKDKSKNKKNNVIMWIGKETIKLLFNINEDDLKQLKQIINNKIPEKINETIENTYVFYDKYGDKLYYVPKQIKEFIKDLDIKDYNESKTTLVVSFYIEANGIINIDKLIELVRATGISVTKNIIKKIITESSYFIKDDYIYNSKDLYNSDIVEKILKNKEKNEYKTYNQEEIMMLMYFMNIRNIDHYIVDIYQILIKKIKDNNIFEDIMLKIFNYIRINSEYKNDVLNILKINKIELSDKEKDKLFNILKKVSVLYPKWELNGQMEELNGVNPFKKDELDECSFEELDEDEKLEIYIVEYIAINGVIKVDKMIEILKYHNIDITSRKLIKFIKSVPVINVRNGYIIYGDKEDDPEIIYNIKLLDKYKLIDNMELFDEETELNNSKIIDICLKYNIPMELAEGVLMIIITGIYNKDMINTYLTDNGSVYSKNIIDKLYKELELKAKDIRTWKYNGYTENEVIKFNIK